MTKDIHVYFLHGCSYCMVCIDDKRYSFTFTFGLSMTKVTVQSSHSAGVCADELYSWVGCYSNFTRLIMLGGPRGQAILPQLLQTFTPPSCTTTCTSSTGLSLASRLLRHEFFVIPHILHHGLPKQIHHPHFETLSLLLHDTRPSSRHTSFFTTHPSSRHTSFFTTHVLLHDTRPSSRHPYFFTTPVLLYDTLPSSRHLAVVTRRLICHTSFVTPSALHDRRPSSRHSSSPTPRLIPLANRSWSRPRACSSNISRVG
jgi:hypothetical protein